MLYEKNEWSTHTILLKTECVKGHIQNILKTQHDEVPSCYDCMTVF